MPCYSIISHFLSPTTHQMKNLSVLALPSPCPCPCHVGDCGVRGKRCRFEPGSREIKRPHVPVRPVMPALPHGLEIFDDTAPIKFLHAAQSFRQAQGAWRSNRTFESGSSAYCGCREVSFCNPLYLRGWYRKCMVCCHQCHAFVHCTVSVQSVVRQFRTPQHVLD